MTSAWYVNMDEGESPERFALPLPEGEGLTSGWEQERAATIGITRDGRVRLARFYGFATGCETRDCSIPSPAWSLTTIDPVTLGTASQSSEVGFLVDADSSYWDTRLSPDATWIYARLYEPDGASAIRIGTGEIRAAPRIQVPPAHRSKARCCSLACQVTTPRRRSSARSIARVRPRWSRPFAHRMARPRRRAASTSPAASSRSRRADSRHGET
jgi:hypothetical protein